MKHINWRFVSDRSVSTGFFSRRKLLPSQRLWLAVLERAIMDLNHADRKVSTQAAQWLLGREQERGGGVSRVSAEFCAAACGLTLGLERLCQMLQVPTKQHKESLRQIANFRCHEKHRASWGAYRKPKKRRIGKHGN